MSPQTATAMQPSRAMVPIRQTGADLFDTINDTIARRAYELFDWNGRWHGRDLEDWLRAEEQVLHPVHLDVEETENEYTVRAEVPGFTSKELDIKVEPFRVSIAGKRESTEEEKKGRKLRAEMCANHILRTVEFPAHVDTSRVRATLKDGILTIEVPKAPHAKAVHLEPKAA